MNWNVLVVVVVAFVVWHSIHEAAKNKAATKDNIYPQQKLNRLHTVYKYHYFTFPGPCLYFSFVVVTPVIKNLMRDRG
jgi:hypothetical protein